MEQFLSITLMVIRVLANLITIAIGLAIAWIMILYFIDKFQTESTLRRNYPVLARLRYFFEDKGTFFRQYFFAMIAKKCHLTVLNDLGYIVLQKM